MIARQLALALPHAESFACDDFLPGPSNISARALIDRWPDWPNRAVVLTGPEGAGKSHLAAIWAEDSGARFVAGKSLAETDPLRALATGALVVEDLEAKELAQPALFHLLNLVREQNAFLLLTARTPPAGWSLTLADLASRLRALPVVALAPPDDALLRAVIVKLAADRQLTLDEGVVGYLVTRIERSFAAAREAVARLDHEAMRLKRPVTRALAADLFRADT